MPDLGCENCIAGWVMVLVVYEKREGGTAEVHRQRVARDVSPTELEQIRQSLTHGDPRRTAWDLVEACENCRPDWRPPAERAARDRAEKKARTDANKARQDHFDEPDAVGDVVEHVRAALPGTEVATPWYNRDTDG